MARHRLYKNHCLLQPVVLGEQIEPDSFAFALQFL